MERRGRLGVAARAVLFVVCSAVVLAAASRWTKTPLAMACLAAIATLLLTMVFVRWEGVRLRDAGAEWVRGSLWRFALAFVLGLGLPLLRTGIVMAVEGVRYERIPGFTMTDAIAALALYIVLASREELAFRGYPLRILEREFGTWTSLAAVTALFVAEHALGGWTWWQAVFGAGVGAVLFGVAALRTRGLAAPIGLHAAWNFGDSMLGGKGTGGLWRPLVDASELARVERAQWVAYVLVMVAASVAIWVWPRRAMKTVED